MLGGEIEIRGCKKGKKGGGGEREVRGKRGRVEKGERDRLGSRGNSEKGGMWRGGSLSLPLSMDKLSHQPTSLFRRSVLGMRGVHLVALFSWDDFARKSNYTEAASAPGDPSSCWMSPVNCGLP